MDGPDGCVPPLARINRVSVGRIKGGVGSIGGVAPGMSFQNLAVPFGLREDNPESDRIVGIDDIENLVIVRRIPPAGFAVRFRVLQFGHVDGIGPHVKRDDFIGLVDHALSRIEPFALSHLIPRLVWVVMPGMADGGPRSMSGCHLARC